MDRDILDIIKSRRSVKRYKSDIVDGGLIEKVLEAGKSAPTGKNLQSPIILAIINREVRDNLSRKCAEVRGLNANVDPFYGAPVVLAVLSDKSIFTHVYDGSCVMENMLLEAHSLGLGACWIHHCKEVFESQYGKDLLKDLGIKGDYEGVGFCILGYSNMDTMNEINRKNDYVYYVK